MGQLTGIVAAADVRHLPPLLICVRGGLVSDDDDPIDDSAVALRAKDAFTRLSEVHPE